MKIYIYTIGQNYDLSIYVICATSQEQADKFLAAELCLDPDDPDFDAEFDYDDCTVMEPSAGAAWSYLA